MGAALLVIGSTRHIDRVVEPDRGFHLIDSSCRRMAEVQLGKTIHDVICGMVGPSRFGIGGYEVVEDR